MLKAVAFVLAATAIPASESEKPVDPMPGIKQFCREKWSDDYSMQKYCREKQTAAEAEIVNLYNLDGLPDEKKHIIDKCLAQWATTREIVDWSMVNYCSHKQITAYDSLKE